MVNWNRVAGWICLYLLAASVYASNHKDDYYRSFWSPAYHGSPLDYCTLDKKSCGLTVANEYCRLMGYKKSRQHIIAHNVGLTNFIHTNAQCKGWTCNGFKLIRCVNQMKHMPVKAYYYREQTFTYPRMNGYRIDWCYKKEQACGQRAAYSFCRQMGYLNATHIKQADHVFATKTLGDQALCFGVTCRAFKHITCHR